MFKTEPDYSTPTSAAESNFRIRKPVRVWLFIGVVMVFFQVVIGGVTRLTDSGLSITEWAVIQGTIPPLNEVEWLEAFEMYKHAAKKQFESLHADMTLPEFKVIYFWEYFHRLWARLMGFVFLFPFLFFLWMEGKVMRFFRQLGSKNKNEVPSVDRGWMPGWLTRRLGVVILLAMAAATFGWIMVASGLNNDDRTWVSAYKLVIHLGIATTLFGYLFWTWLRASQPGSDGVEFPKLKRQIWVIAFVLFVQIIFGGLMAGMRAGLIHPHFPAFVEGEKLWSALTATTELNAEGIIDYEPNRFAKAAVQVLHRGMAYVLTILIFIFFRRTNMQSTPKRLKLGTRLMTGMLVVQFLLGISTVINSVGKIPVSWGAIHQAGALLLLVGVLFVAYQLKRGRERGGFEKT